MAENTTTSIQQVQQKSDWLNTFVERNLWAIIVISITGLIVFTTVRLTVSVNAQSIKSNTEDIEKLDEKVVEMTKLVERIIILEERDKNYSEQIKELQSDVKSIGKAVGAENIKSE